jgi:putative sigma-54 modulation protein
MKYDIHGDKLIITDGIRSYIDEKLGRLNRYFKEPEKITARIVLKVRGRDQIIEVTIPTNLFTLRTEEAHFDLYAAIDLVIDKLERQLVKNKNKMQKDAIKVKNNEFIFENIEEYDEDKKEIIVKRKKLDTKPMNEEEAILQMNLIGHDFFIYRDAETNEVNVLYRRKDGNYGIIETK